MNERVTVDDEPKAEAPAPVQPSRPSIRELLVELSVDDETIRTILTLTSAYRSLGRSVELQRYATLGKDAVRGDGAYGRVRKMTPQAIMRSAMTSRSGNSVARQREALDVIARGVKAHKERERQERTRGMLKQSHLFIFDEDAFQVAAVCAIPLERLPFQTCLVENVLLSMQNDQIAVRPLVKGADVEVAMRLMSFVINCCTETHAGKSNVHYVSMTAAKDSDSRTSTSRRAHIRRGHYRHQAYGPGQSLRKLIWIDDTFVSESTGVNTRDIKQVHRVSLRRGTEAGAVTGVEV